MLTIGKSNYLRFNNPAEAELLRSTIGSKDRISMPQIDFTQDSTSSGGSSTEGSPADEMMKHEPIYSSNNRNSKQSAVLDKVSKTEFPSNMNNFHSPKVFTADSITVNTPAKDVLGAKFNNFTKNLTHMFGNNKHSSQRTNNNLIEHSAASNGDANQGHPAKGVGLTKVNNTSPAAAPVTATSPKIQQFSACYDRYPKPGSYGSLQVFPMNNVNNEMNTSGQEAEPPAPIAHVPNHSMGLTELQRQRAQIERMQEQEISKKEHERLDEILKMCADFERQNQNGSNTVQSSPIVQNRIKTNGSLPREKKNYIGSSPESNGPDLFYPNSPVDDRLPPKPTSGYENVKIGPGRRVELSPESKIPPPSGYENITSPKKPGYVPQSPRTRIKTCVSPKKDPTPNKKSEYDLLVQSFEEKLRMEIQLLRENKQMNNGKLHNGVGDAQAGSSTEPEPVYGTLEKRNKNVNHLTLILQKDVDVKRSEQLRAERKLILGQVREMKARIADLQRQEEEVIREVSVIPLLIRLCFSNNSIRFQLDMEKALVTAELSTEQAHLMTLQRNIGTLQSKIQRMEAQRMANRTMQETQQNKLKHTIDVKQSQIEE